MKNKFTFLIALFFFYSVGLLAQSTDIPGYDKFANKFGDEDLQTMEKVKAELTDAVTRMSAIQKEEPSLQKYFQKKNTNKAEKKSVPLKQKWIGAYTIYLNANNSVYDMYNSWLNEAKYYDENTRQQVTQLSSQAEVDRSKSNDLFGGYRKSSESDLKKNVKYNKMKVDLNQASKLSTEALNLMVEALQLVFAQEELMSKDEVTWKKALADDTFDGYVGYIKDFPTGKHVDEAKLKIKEYKERIARENELREKANSELFYKVQIVAVSKQLSVHKQKRLYSKTNEIEVYLDPLDNLYKYYVGKFAKYDDAKAFEAKLKIKDAFVIGYKNGQRIDILDAIALEKSKAGQK
jgi:hypothetical protein